MRVWEAVLVVALLVLEGSSQWVWAHGEDKPGPHGGWIQMPGGFHTELKLEKQKVAIYLLDMNWKNPVVENSNVEAHLIKSVSPGAKASLSCVAAKRRFVCPLPPGLSLKTGDKIEIRASRQGQPGVPVFYEYPFKATGRTSFGHH